MEHPSQQLFSTAVLEQQALIPEIYGDVDFNRLPERYEQAFDINRLRPSKHRDYCQRVLERPELIKLIRNYTMTGDAVADAYAALIPEYGFKTLVTMLEAACHKGVENVHNAPDELVAFIRAMEESKPAKFWACDKCNAENTATWTCSALFRVTIANI